MPSNDRHLPHHQHETNHEFSLPSRMHAPQTPSRHRTLPIPNPETLPPHLFNLYRDQIMEQMRASVNTNNVVLPHAPELHGMRNAIERLLNVSIRARLPLNAISTQRAQMMERTSARGSSARNPARASPARNPTHGPARASPARHTTRTLVTSPIASEFATSPFNPALPVFESNTPVDEFDAPLPPPRNAPFPLRRVGHKKNRSKQPDTAPLVYHDQPPMTPGTPTEEVLWMERLAMEMNGAQGGRWGSEQGEPQSPVPLLPTSNQPTAAPRRRVLTLEERRRQMIQDKQKQIAQAKRQRLAAEVKRREELAHRYEASMKAVSGAADGAASGTASKNAASQPRRTGPPPPTRKQAPPTQSAKAAHIASTLPATTPLSQRIAQLTAHTHRLLQERRAAAARSARKGTVAQPSAAPSVSSFSSTPSLMTAASYSTPSYVAASSYPAPTSYPAPSPYAAPAPSAAPVPAGPCGGSSFVNRPRRKCRCGGGSRWAGKSSKRR